MKNVILKSLSVSFLLLFNSQTSAQEADSTVIEGPQEGGCRNFPRCVDESGSSDYTNSEEESQWSLLWEKLTKEMKEAVESLPAPKQPE